MERFRIYGDNILECEEGLRLVTRSLGGQISFISSKIYAPEYAISRNGQVLYHVQLCPGYGRWLYDVLGDFRRRGSLLREAPDVIITRINPTNDADEEYPILALEFSGALPAGNNAWQRCGRAVSCAQAGVPYLYFAELGGIELDARREVISARFPNPIIPFAYCALGNNYDSFAMPVYQASPSISEMTNRVFKDYFGGAEVLDVIRGIIEGQPLESYVSLLREKALGVTKMLAGRTVRSRQLSAMEWETIGELKSGTERADWFVEKGMPWAKKVSIPTSETFSALLRKTTEIGACAVGSRDLPFCVLPSSKRTAFAQYLRSLYPGRLADDFLAWLETFQKPLVLVWIAGFKPAGEDSRPDRGLVPLARMVLGEDVDLLSIVYGPGQVDMWRILERDIWQLAETNGLWQAVIYLSNGILIDHPNAAFLSSYGIRIPTVPSKPESQTLLPLKSASLSPKQFGEHDVDSVLHLVFSAQCKERFFEGLCNPPGGNWSGLSLFDRVKNEEVRWVSLPRVSGDDSKRPDHVFQFSQPPDRDTLLIVESKDRATKVEKNIGERLARYVRELLAFPPNIMRQNQDTAWSSLISKYAFPEVDYVTAAAFRYTSSSELSKVLNNAGVDIAFGVECRDPDVVTLHVDTRRQFDWLQEALDSAQSTFGDRLKVQIYRLSNLIK